MGDLKYTDKNRSELERFFYFVIVNKKCYKFVQTSKG
jgi:hypothetical protein